MNRAEARRLSLLVVLAAVACSGDSVAPSEPTFLGATVEQNPLNVLSGILTVEAVGFDSASARYWTGAEEPRSTPAYPFASDSTVRVPVLGLRETTSYQVETIVYAGGQPLSADTATLNSGLLPSWIPGIGALGSDTTPGLLAISIKDGGVIVNNEGRVVWYAHRPGGVLNSFQSHANGTYTLRGQDGTINVLNVFGEDIGTIGCVGFESRFHDVMILADGSTWMMCDDTRVMDLSAIGGDAAAEVTATVIQHISAGGQVLFQWNAFDHFELTDLPAEDRAGPSVNFTHGNALELDTDGNLLASFRSLSEITKIDATSGDVIWRFGGLASEFTILNDPKGAFQRQHGVRLAGPAQIQFLDNGTSAPSRMVRYLLNPVQHTALLVMSFEDSPATFTPVGGGTDYYPNGNGVVSFGQAGRVVEADAAGNRAWELTGVDGLYVFRAERIASLYDPGTLSRRDR